jgi:group I intron endonuclease
MIGIYCITNKVNGKKYIGQSWNIEKRWKEHLSSKRKDHLRFSFEKYGTESFAFTVLKEFGNHGLTQIMMDMYERKYIIVNNTIDSKFGYNKNTGGGSSSIVSQEIKDKISKSKTGKPKPVESIQRYREGTLRYLAKHGSPCTGIPKSEETKAKISKKLTGSKWTEERRNNYKCTDEMRQKMISSHLGSKWSEKRWEAYHNKYGGKK